MHQPKSEEPQAPPFFNFATDVLDRWARLRPESQALWHVNAATRAEQKFTFAQLAALSRQAASFLRDSGVKRGDRVLLMLPRVPQWWIAMLGLIRLGAVPVPATLLLTGRDVAFRIRSANITAAITSEDGVAKVGAFDGLRFLAGSSSPPAGWLDFDRGVREAKARFRHERTRSDEPGILYFTSATTGEPKMVLHTQASYGLGHRLTGELWLDLKPDDVHWNISDLGWGKAAWSSFFGPWQMGACVFALDVAGKFDPVLTLDTLAQFPITTWCAPPTALRLHRATGPFQVAFSPSAPLRHRGRAAQPGGAPPLARRHGPDAARSLRPDRDGRARRQLRIARLPGAAGLDGQSGARFHAGLAG